MSPAGFLLGSGVAGVGLGLAFLGAFRALSALAPPEQRAGLIATIYIVSYLAFGVPAVAAGVAASQFGLHDTALVYAGVLMFLIAIATTSFALRRASHAHLRRPVHRHLDLPPLACSLPHCAETR